MGEKYFWKLSERWYIAIAIEQSNIACRNFRCNILTGGSQNRYERFINEAAAIFIRCVRNNSQVGATIKAARRGKIDRWKSQNNGLEN